MTPPPAKSIPVSIPPPVLRPAEAKDIATLAAIYRDTVLVSGPQAYTPTQVAAWAGYADDLPAFASRLANGLVLIAEIDGAAIAFGQLDPDDHLAFLYCLATWSRRGIGGLLYQALEARALARGVPEIHTEASRFSRPFFTKHGYTLRGTERVHRSGVEFERYLMGKCLQPPPTAQPLCKRPR